MKSVFVSFLSILSVLLVTVVPTQALTCVQEQFLVSPCLKFLTKVTDHPSRYCCQGLYEIILWTPTKEEQQAACTCLNKAFSYVPNLNMNRANSLSKDCKFNVHHPNSDDDLDCKFSPSS